MKENILIRPYFPKDLFHCGALALYGGGGENPANIEYNSEHISKGVNVLHALCLTRICQKATLQLQTVRFPL